MPNEPEINENLFSDATPVERSRDDVFQVTSTQPDPVIGLIEIVIERDLAVQVVGSDAGRCRRIKPHSSMTRGASRQEIDDVSLAMSGFLDDEIRRVFQDKAHRPRFCKVILTPQQAMALAAFCRRYASFLRTHIEKHPGDESLSRSQQRRNQALRVISQIDAALGIPEADAISKDQIRSEAIAQAEILNTALAALKNHAEAVIDPANTFLLELKETVQLCLSQCGRS
jgi:hypothetical protein